MKNPIPKSAFFAEPKKSEELKDLINGYEGLQRAAAMAAASWAINLCHHIVQEAIDAETKGPQQAPQDSAE